MSILSWFKDRIIAFGAIILAVLTVLGMVYNKGRREEKAEVEKKSTELSEKAHGTASEVEQHIAKLPAPPKTPASLGNGGATRVGDAPANTATGELRDDWTRDKDSM